jgi:hypothetical protein
LYLIFITLDVFGKWAGNYKNYGLFLSSKYENTPFIDYYKTESKFEFIEEDSIIYQNKFDQTLFQKFPNNSTLEDGTYSFKISRNGQLMKEYTINLEVTHNENFGNIIKGDIKGSSTLSQSLIQFFGFIYDNSMIFILTERVNSLYNFYTFYVPNNLMYKNKFQGIAFIPVDPTDVRRRDQLDGLFQYPVVNDLMIKKIL